MKRYLCFTGQHYYADGGWLDFRGAYDSIEEAVADNPVGKRIGQYSIETADWRHVVDAETHKVVESEPSFEASWTHPIETPANPAR